MPNTVFMIQVNLIDGMMKSIGQKILVTILAIFFVTSAYAVEHKYSETKSLNQAQSFDVFALQDQEYDYLANGNPVDLSFGEHGGVVFKLWLSHRNASLEQATTAKVTINYTYEYREADNAAWLLSSNQSTVLTLDYDPYIEVSVDQQAFYLKSTDDQRIGKVNITSFTIDPNGTLIPDNLKFTATLFTAVNYELDLNAIQSTAVSSTYNANKNELIVEWPSKRGTEWYDLEWTYVNDYKDVGEYFPKSDLSMPNFRLNSTRVSVKRTKYAIPLVYEHGYLLYRVRAVGRSAQDEYKSFVPGLWTCLDEGLNLLNYETTYGTIFALAGHESDLNWQGITNFAEEGKRKQAVSYFDGSLRNRQSVSHLNTENQTIVGETVYDHQGRAAIQILPVPTGDSLIKYYKDFNKEQLTEEPFHWSHFEVDNEQEKCNPVQTGLSDQSGASKYYSPNNGDLSDENTYIPDADNFPYTQIQYTSDNTGRVKRQGGVGKDHQLGSNHESKYYYSQPEQYELDMLFGSEAGNSLHYKKNTVVDPNGEISISYLDPQGRVIATALSGVHNDSILMHANDLVDATPFDLDVFGIEASKNEKTTTANSGQAHFYKETVYDYKDTKDDNPDFTYDISIPPFKYEELCKDGSTVWTFCDTCVFDLKVSLIDDCGKQYLSDRNEAYNGIEAFTATLEGVDCDNDATQTIEFYSEMDREIGKYSLNKTLVLNDEKLQKVTQKFLNSEANCGKTLQDFEDQELAEVMQEITDCDYTCADCLENLRREYPGSPSEDDPSYSDYVAEHADYRLSRELCDALCGPASLRCESMYQGMLSDVSPHGQYALLMNAPPSADGFKGEDIKNLPSPDLAGAGDQSIDRTMAPEQYPLSIFNPNNRLPNYYGKAYYKHPLGTREGKSAGNFYNERGEKDYVQVAISKDANNNLVYDPEIKMYNDGIEKLLEFQQGGGVNIGFFWGNWLINPIQNSYNDLNYLDQHFGSDFQIIDENTVAVNPKYLRHYEDFVNSWQNPWAASLVKMHPEYPVYEQCLYLKESHRYNQEMLLTVNPQEASQNSTVTNEPMLTQSGAYYFGNLEADPFFNGDFNFPNERSYVSAGNYHDAFEKRLLEYQKDGTLSYRIEEIAYSNVNCPSNSTIDQYCTAPINCPEGKGINDETTWDHYKTLYFAEKQFYEDQYIKHSTTRLGVSNLCIGNKEFQLSDLFVVDPEVEIDGSESLASTFGDWEQRFYSASPSFFGNWTNYNYLAFRNSSACGALTFKLYEDKVPRYPLNETMVDDEGRAEYCYSSDTIFDQAVCPESSEKLIHQLRQKFNLQIYEDCGQCPVTWEFKEFVKSMLADHNVWGRNSSVTLGCMPYTEVPMFTPFLQNTMGFNEGEVKWDLVERGQDLPEVDINGRTLDRFKFEGQLTGTSTGQSCQVAFYLDGAGIKQATNEAVAFDVAKLSDLCCLNYDASPDMLTVAEIGTANNGVFDFKATYDFDDEADSDPVLLALVERYSLNMMKANKLEVEGEGVITCLNLKDCQIEAQCLLTERGYRFQDVLSALVFDFNNEGRHFLKEQALNEMPYTFLLEGALKDMYGSNAWLWKPHVDANGIPQDFVYNGVSYSSNGGSILYVTIEIDNNGTPEEIVVSFDAGTAGFDFALINKFTGMRANKNVADPSKEFYISARVDNGTNGYDVLQMAGKILSATDPEFIECTTPVVVDLSVK